MADSQGNAAIARTVPVSPKALPSSDEGAVIVAGRFAAVLPAGSSPGSFVSDPPGPDLTPVPGAALMRGEDVLLLCVTLPAMTAAQRRATIGYAVEDMVAQPLDEVHVVLGPQIRGAWLVAVAGHAAMAAIGGPQTLRLLPDVLMLPLPDEGGCSVWAAAGRVLVRTADGAGFATTPDRLRALWQAAGSPRITLFGGALPDWAPVAARAALPALPDPALAGFDLRLGSAGRRAGGLPRVVRGLIVVAVLAAVGHLAVLGLDVLGLGRIADGREAAVRAALSAEGQSSPGSDIDTALTQALAARQPAASGGFLPLLSTAMAAVAGEAGTVLVDDMQFESRGNTLVLMLEASDLETLQRLEGAFAAAGLRVTAGAASSANGAAEARMSLQAGG